MGIIGFVFGVIAIVFIIKHIRFFLKVLKWLIIGIPVLLICIYLIPGTLDEIITGVVVFILTVINVILSVITGIFSSSSDYVPYTSSSDDYVLNKKSGVIHKSWDHSAGTISERHRKSLSYYEAEEMVNRGKKYRYKKEP